LVDVRWQMIGFSYDFQNKDRTSINGQRSSVREFTDSTDAE